MGVGTGEVHLEWGGQEMIIPNGGVYPSAAENGGGTHARPKAARKRAPPLSLFLAPSLNDGEISVKSLDCIQFLKMLIKAYSLSH